MTSPLSRIAEPLDNTALPDSLLTLLADLVGEKKPSGLHNLLNQPKLWTSSHFLLLLKNLAENDQDKLAILVPQAVAKGRSAIDGHDKADRLAIIAKNLLDTAIGLPTQVLNSPHGPVVVLLFNTTKTDSNVLMIQSTQKYHTEMDKQFLQDAQLRKIYATYRRVRAPRSAPSNPSSSPVCYSDQFDDLKPGILIDHYAYLATPRDLAARHCSVNPADYVR